MTAAPVLSISRRTRGTPFTARVEAEGVKGYTVYNHMLLPTFFESVEADYHHLKRHVQVWDVACERQIEVFGPDAARLLQMLTPRDLSGAAPGQCLYAPMVDETGGMLNDPVVLKLADDRWWISIADSDLLFWVKGVAYGCRLDVSVEEPEVSPLAVQGPKAEELMARVFGERVRDIRYFRYATLAFEGVEMIVARSGYSKQGGFEIYVEGSEIAEPLWDALFEKGKDLEVRAGGPNLIERIESGLLSYGNDMTRVNTPHECGLGRFCTTAEAIGCIGRDALLRVAIDGPLRQIRGLTIAGDPLRPCRAPLPVAVAGKDAGQVTSLVWSPDLRSNIAIAMIEREHWATGTAVEIETPEGIRSAEVRALPFL
ncbi:MAG TPA: dimethylsulfoniopropionate demethylase [Kiloniellaceae bacterium]|nr:dimethylsulfoniopropionate demethylase [Kiloniellaceae bacterium]